MIEIVFGVSDLSLHIDAKPMLSLRRGAFLYQTPLFLYPLAFGLPVTVPMIVSWLPGLPVACFPFLPGYWRQKNSSIRPVTQEDDKTEGL